MAVAQEILKLVEERSILRKAGRYEEADLCRRKIELAGYVVKDGVGGSTIESSASENTVRREGPGKIALFGSGESSPTGRAIHEELIKDLGIPVKIALLQTPAGFEQNPDLWYRRLGNYLSKGLANYQPQISFVRALRSEGEESTNSESQLAPLGVADYIHTGAGSPTYAAMHLKNSLALKIIKYSLLKKGVSLSLASASAIAFSRFVMPVYEIYKAGHDLHWDKGIGFFTDWGFDPVFIPHWNNREGGADVDTSRCYMGTTRFERMLSLLPRETVIAGIDEQTALVMDLKKRLAAVRGVGTVTLIYRGGKKIFKSGEVVGFDLFS